MLANEYPANFIPWLKKKKDGIVLRVIRGKDNEAGVEELIRAIGPKTRAVAISWIQHYDGFTADIAKLSRICRKRGIFLALDAVHGVGDGSGPSPDTGHAKLLEVPRLS